MSKGLKIFIVFFLIATGVAVRLLCVLPAGLPDGDSAVAGLLAMRILEGREFPIYTPLSHYGGSLTSYIEALVFKLFGTSSFSFRMVGVLYSCLWGLFAYLLARKAIGLPGALFVLAFLALPSYIPLSLSVLTGVYAATFIFTSLLLLALCRWSDISKPRTPAYLGLGFLSGLGLWLTPWTFPALGTIGTVFFIRRKDLHWKEGAFFVLAFLLGYLPALFYDFQHPGAQLFRLGGRILDLDRSVLSSSDLIGIVAGRVLWRISTIPASLARIPWLLMSCVGLLNGAAFWAGCATAYKRQKALSSTSIVLIFILWYCFFYAALVGEKELRYVAPLMSILPVFLGALCAFLHKRSRMLCFVVFAALVLNNCFDFRYSLSKRYIPGYKQLSSWLLSRGISYGYSDSEIAYPVMFESRQKITMSPTLFHATFSDRWPEQTAEVRKQENAAFVINSRSRPGAELLLDQGLKKIGVLYEKDAVGEFIVYRRFSRNVLPEELNFYGERP